MVNIETYEHLARRGLRVLALAYKRVSASDLGLSKGHVMGSDYSPAREGESYPIYKPY